VPTQQPRTVRRPNAARGLALALPWLLACSDAPATQSFALDAASQGDAAALRIDAGAAQGGPSDSAVVVPSAVDAATRFFSMGFTPFPYDVTLEAVEDTYAMLTREGDLYAFHTTDGVPWAEAEQGTGFEGYGSAIRGTWQSWRSHVAQRHEVYLALTPLNDARDGLADAWGDSAHMPLPAGFAGLAFDDPRVVRAYIAHCRDAVHFFDPTYLALGIEVNILRDKAPEKWASYASLQRQAYSALKADFPTLPMFVTVTAPDLLEGFTDKDLSAQRAALADVLPYSDYLALSLYPYMSAYSEATLPADTFDRLAELAQGKQLAIAESGYTAEPFTLESYGLTIDGSTQAQRAWIARLLAEADARKMRFVVNFVARDYDALWEKLTSGRELAEVWRDTGLFDGAGGARPALDEWRRWLAIPLRR
jgi:hypothetical protein